MTTLREKILAEKVFGRDFQPQSLVLWRTEVVAECSLECWLGARLSEPINYSRPESSSQGTRKLGLGACAWTSILAHSYPPWCTSSSPTRFISPEALNISVRAFRNTPPRCPWTFLMLCHQHTRGGVFITNLNENQQVKVEKMFQYL